ncbi:MAG: hypothetical protein J6K75_03985 [Erysipelotrichaceae bacterium]|nr:hypothetical protein [Erysipelotrichaceae bacterium]
MKRHFTTFILQEHVFSITLSVFLMLTSRVITSSIELANLFMIAGTVFLLVSLLPMISKLIKLNLFLKENHINAAQCKIIENAAFNEEMVYAYSFQQMTALPYTDITVVRHVQNIHEKTRPGYKGNHKVVLMSKFDKILIPVKNEEIAEIIMNFIKTKNPAVEFQHKQSTYTPTHLSDLQNWSVDGRF